MGKPKSTTREADKEGVKKTDPWFASRFFEIVVILPGKKDAKKTAKLFQNKVIYFLKVMIREDPASCLIHKKDTHGKTIHCASDFYSGIY